MTAKLVGIGYCSWDTLCILPKIPYDEKVRITETLEQGGGPCATAIYAAAKLGIDTAFMSAVGDDSNGKAIVQAMRAIGINTDGLKERNDSKSASAICWVDKTTGKRSIAWTRGDAVPLTYSELPKDLLADADMLHLDGHQGDAALPAAEYAVANGIHVSIDAGTMTPNIERLLELSDIIIASETFAKNITKQDDPAKACEILFEYGHTHFAGVTVGSKGSYGFDGENSYFQPSFPVNVVDTTGAGDTYHGAFDAFFLMGYPYAECMKWASATSAMKCTKLGGRTGLPTLPELKEFVQKNS